jgi:hypothetical protein
VRPAEPAWPGPAPTLTPEEQKQREQLMANRPRINPGENRNRYADAVRDWAEHGAASPFALSPDEVIEQSQPRPAEVSAAAAHFELAQHLWRAGRRDGAIRHFEEARRLQPDNWTYKRQAWSLVSREQAEGGRGAFTQGPVENADWPFESDFWSDIAELDGAEYYPTTIPATTS